MAKETAKTIIYVIMGALVILAWGIAFGAIKSDVNYIGKETSDNTEQIKAIKDQMGVVKEKLTRIDTRQEVMITSLEKIDRSLSQ